MPFEDNSFDAVVAASSLDHVKDVNKALSEITRVMKPDAHFYLYSSVWNTPTIDKRHTYSWTSDELFELLGEYFIVNRYIWYVNTLTIPVLFYDGITEDT